MNADVFLRRSVKAAAKTREVRPWAALASNRAAHVRLYRETLALMKKGEGKEEDIALLEGQAQEIERLAQSVRRLGVERMASGLLFSLNLLTAGGSPASVLELINELRDLGFLVRENPTAVEALKSCLSVRNQLVRFEASSALALLRPPMDAQTAAEVIKNLSLTIADPGARVALIVSPDDDVRARFTALLDQNGFLPLAVESVWRGIAEASVFPPKHIIFLDSNLIELGVPETIEYLRATRGAAEVPIVVVSRARNEARDQNLYRKPENKVDVVADTISAADLRAKVLDPVVKQAQDTRAAGEVRAARAAESILGLLDAQVSYDLSPTRKSLVMAASDNNRPDTVRIPACGCLSHFGDEGVLKNLFQVAKDKERSSVAVRVAAIRAIGDIMGRSGFSLSEVKSSVSGDAEKILVGYLTDKEKALRVEAARTLGKAKWTPELFLDVEAKNGAFTQ